MSLGGQLGSALGRTLAGGRGSSTEEALAKLKLLACERIKPGTAAESGTRTVIAKAQLVRLTIWGRGSNGTTADYATGAGGANAQSVLPASPGDTIGYSFPAYVDTANGARPANSTVSLNGVLAASAEAASVWNNSGGNGSPALGGRASQSIGQKTASGGDGGLSATVGDGPAGGALRADGRSGGGAGGVGPFPGGFGDGSEPAGGGYNAVSAATSAGAPWLVIEYYGDPL